MGNNQAARIRQRAKNLEWTDEILSPGEVLNKYDLPVFVTVAKEDPQADLAKDDILLLRSSYSERNVFARRVHRSNGRLYGPLMTIPLRHPAKFVIFKKVFYNNVNELLRANPFPQSFKVEENVTWGESGRSQEAFELLGLLSMKMSQNKDGGHGFTKDTSPSKPKVINMSAVVGDCLTAIDKTGPVQDFEEENLEISKAGGKEKTSTLKKIKRSFKGKKKASKTKLDAQPTGYIVCTNQTGGLVCLHTDCAGRFSAYLPEHHTMEELLEKCKLPGDVEVVGGQLPNDHPNFEGRLRLLSFCTETFIVVNGLPRQGEVTEARAEAAKSVEMSIDSDVRFTPANNRSPQNAELLNLLQGHLQRVRPSSEGCVAAVSAGAATDAMKAEWAESQDRARAASLVEARRKPAMATEVSQAPPGKQISWWRRLYNSSRRRSSQLTETSAATPTATGTGKNWPGTGGYGSRPLDIIEEASGTENSDTENSDIENSDTDNSSIGLGPEEQEKVVDTKKGGWIANGGLVSKALSKMGRRH
ncbi:PREDICTED: uncharacterized protein LOC109476231 [Branchiostoma belcheri]|uniref:Uncharacterized protein LOC109476231 n=1 Tax=Branchiostoma belcheri TaxID=7741 RepID=A0A6P4ZST6_BRABE|nr:PREDICTED: uncharacterized protein LOC109476231 [Branchiostoma belcheri]